MKKKLFSLLMAMLSLSNVSINAQPVEVELGFMPVDPSGNQTNPHKAPPLIPWMGIDGHDLIFESAHADYSIDIVQSGIVVYSVDVDATTTSVELPSWLSGEYELQLYPDGSSYYFYGDITL